MQPRASGRPRVLGTAVRLPEDKRFYYSQSGDIFKALYNILAVYSTSFDAPSCPVVHPDSNKRLPFKLHKYDCRHAVQAILLPLNVEGQDVQKQRVRLVQWRVGRCCTASHVHEIQTARVQSYAAGIECGPHDV